MNIFLKHIIDGEIIVNQEDFALIKSTYSQDFIINEISYVIDLADVKLPYRLISEADWKNDYNLLKNTTKEDLTGYGKWGSKFDYKYDFLDEYINISNVGNKASDYFHQVERWKCDATGYPSPAKTWSTEQFRLTLFKAIFSLNIKEINPNILRNLISLRKYIAAQFRPSVAKFIYDTYKPETVLDFSMGWGDRILGAHVSDSVKKYVGIDPNVNLFDGYQKQIDSYNSLGNVKNYELLCGCAEDESLVLNDEFDMIFTSPPYFDKEKYDQSSNQSYIKYHKFDSWMKDFLFKTIELRTKNLKSGGYLIINISDIYTRKKHYQICDGMNDFISTMGCYEYQGCLGFKMPKRPMSKSCETIGVYAEPVWVHRKK